MCISSRKETRYFYVTLYIIIQWNEGKWRGIEKEGKGRRRKRKRRGNGRELGKTSRGEKRPIEDNRGRRESKKYRGRRENREYRIRQKPATPPPHKSKAFAEKDAENACIARKLTIEIHEYNQIKIFLWVSKILPN